MLLNAAEWLLKDGVNSLDFSLIRNTQPEAGAHKENTVLSLLHLFVLGDCFEYIFLFLFVVFSHLFSFTSVHKTKQHLVREEKKHSSITVGV